MKHVLFIGFLISVVFILVACVELQSGDSTDGEILADNEIAALEEGATEESENLLGQPIKRSRRIVYQNCIDSDGGADYDEEGTVTVSYLYGNQERTRTLTDRCGQDRLIEYSCNDNRHSISLTRCDFGCSDGACNPLPGTCEDTDDGVDYYMQGTVFVDGFAYDHTDYCRGETRLYEQSCGSNPIERGDTFIISSGTIDYSVVYREADACEGSYPTIRFIEEGEGNMLERPIGEGGSVSLTLGGQTFNFQILDCNARNSPIELVDGEFISEESYTCPDVCFEGSCEFGIPDSNETNESG